MLSNKIICLNDQFSFPIYEIDEFSPSITQKFMKDISVKYTEYLKSLINFLKITEFKSLTKDFGLVKSTLDKKDSKDIISIMNRLQKLVDLIKPQLNQKESCAKNRLLNCYLGNTFTDLSKAYVMYFTGMEILKKRFSALKTRSRVNVFNHYEYFLKFTKEMSSYTQTIPYMLGLKITVQKLYEPNPETLKNLKQKMEQKEPAASMKTIPQNSWLDEGSDSEKCNSEEQVENFFSLKSINPIESKFQSVSQQSSKRFELIGDTYAIDNLLMEASQEIRSNAVPSQSFCPSYTSSDENLWR
jgi:hypothetical protein